MASSWYAIRPVGKCGLLALVLGYLTAPAIFHLNFSYMMELPAYSMALASAALGRKYLESNKRAYLFLSATLFAMALHIKFTAAIVFPAIFFQMVWPGKEMAPPGRTFSLRPWVHWMGGAAGIFLVIAVAGPPIQWDVMLQTHFAPEVVSRTQYRFPMSFLIRHWDVALGAAGALLICVMNRRLPGSCRFPLALLLTAVPTHAIHRPCWYYYYLHFAVPLSMLFAIFVHQALVQSQSMDSKSVVKRWGSHLLRFGIVCLILHVSIYGFSRIAYQWRGIVANQEPARNVILHAMQQHAPGTRHVFTRQLMYPFYLKRDVIPEVALLPDKRFWSGQISSESVARIVERHAPEQLLLDSADLKAGNWEWLARSHTCILRTNDMQLWVKK